MKTMVFTPKSSGLALLSLGLLAARGATAVSNCAGLIDAIGVSATIVLESDFSCSSAINVGPGESVSVSGPHVITIDADFEAESTASSLFVNEGSLTLDGVTVESEKAGGVRAVHNEGELSLVGCTFTSLFGTVNSMLSMGGVIFSDSAGDVAITDSAFTSNAVSDKGAALYLVGSETLVITGSTFTDNKVGPGVVGVGDAAGGDIYAGTDVEIYIADTTFTGSEAEYGGAAIECCGGSITNSTFSYTKSDMLGDHFGALLVGRRGADASCPRSLELTETTFTGCSVDSGIGAGGAVAVFDTTAVITDCLFEGNNGTAVLFESSSADGIHKIEMSNNEFNQNTFPAEVFAASVDQGAAVVVVNTGLAEGEDSVPMGSFSGMYCFDNEPYECEFVYDLATITHDGEFKCQVCDMDGVRQAVSSDNENVLGRDGDPATSSEPPESDSQGTIAGLTVALCCALVLIGALGVWKFQARKRARTLMDDMDDQGEF